MIVFKYLKSYFNYSTNGRASIYEFIRLTIINAVFIVFDFVLLEYLGPWLFTIILCVLMWHQCAVTCRRRHDFWNQRETSFISRGNIIEDVIDFSSLFTLDSDEGENKYGPEPWDSKD